MYSSCLHDQQDLCWGNTSRDTSEESQEIKRKLSIIFKDFPLIKYKKIPVTGFKGEKELRQFQATDTIIEGLQLSNHFLHSHWLF